MPTPRLVIPTSFPVTESAPFGGPRVLAGTANGPKPDPRPLRQRMKEFVRDNPASIATGFLAGATLPVSVPGMLGAGALGMGARAIDKANLLSDKPSDFDAVDPADNMRDLLLSGIGFGLFQRVGGRRPKAPVAPVTPTPKPSLGVYIHEFEPPMQAEAIAPTVIGGGLDIAPKIEAFRPIVAQDLVRVGASRTPKFVVAPVESGFPPGYKIHNYEAFPRALEIDRQLAEQGIPRFVNPPAHSGLQKYLVGNPLRNRLIDLPEGEAFEAAKALRDPILPEDQILYSGVHGIRKYPEMAYDQLKPRANWSSSLRAVGDTYVEAGVPQSRYKQLILDKIDQGVFNENNLPEGFSSLDELVEAVTNPDLYHHSIGRNILRNEPEMTGLLQEFVPFASRVKQIERGGEYFQQPSIQTAQLRQAQAEGFDALQYLNQRDPGPYGKSWVSSAESHAPSTVHVALDPRKLKSIYNLGLWDLKDPRILGSIAAGLGANIAVQDNTRQNGK